MNQKTTAPITEEDDSFDLNHPAEFSAETLARGTRYPSEAEHADLLKNLSALPLPEDDSPAATQ